MFSLGVFATRRQEASREVGRRARLYIMLYTLFASCHASRGNLQRVDAARLRILGALPKSVHITRGARDENVDHDFTFCV